jgi:hypothetical protein
MSQRIRELVFREYHRSEHEAIQIQDAIAMLCQRADEYAANRTADTRKRSLLSGETEVPMKNYRNGLYEFPLTKRAQHDALMREEILRNELARARVLSWLWFVFAAIGWAVVVWRVL